LDRHLLALDEIDAAVYAPGGALAERRTEAVAPAEYHAGAHVEERVAAAGAHGRAVAGRAARRAVREEREGRVGHGPRRRLYQSWSAPCGKRGRMRAITSSWTWPLEATRPRLLRSDAPA